MKGFVVVCPKCKNRISFNLDILVDVSVECNKCGNVFIVGDYCLKGGKEC